MQLLSIPAVDLSLQFTHSLSTLLGLELYIWVLEVPFAITVLQSLCTFHFKSPINLIGTFRARGVFHTFEQMEHSPSI